MKRGTFTERGPRSFFSWYNFSASIHPLEASFQYRGPAFPHLLGAGPPGSGVRKEMGIMLDTTDLLGVVGGGKPSSEEDIIERFRRDGRLDVPLALTDADLWANYTNDDLYVMDCKLREFLKKTRYKRQKKGGYRTTCSLVFAWIYGRKPEPSDSSVCRMLHKLLEYYCTSYTGVTTYQGKKVNRVYEFSKYATTNKRPYSLRLRLEEMEDGQDPFRASGQGDRDKRRHGRRRDSEDGE